MEHSLMQPSFPGKPSADAAKPAATANSKQKEETRLAEALRQNLKRRKVQTARARESAAS